MVKSQSLPSISIVVPSFNQAQFLDENLASIFSQDYPRLEVIVIDGGSTDHSLEIIKQWAPRLAYWQSQPDNGQSDAINQGMKRCTSDLIAWLNSDDFYWKDSLWAVGRAFLQHPNFGMYIGNGLRYKHQEKIYQPFCPHHIAFNREALINGLDYVLQPSVFFLREAWEKVGGLKEQLHYVMDWDVILRISQEYPVVTISEFLSVSREYAETKTSTGKMQRIAEIFDMVQGYSGVEITPGGLFYALETLSHLQTWGDMAEARGHMWRAMQSIMNKAHFVYGEGLEWFPAESDPQNATYIPLASFKNQLSARPHNIPVADLPSISVVVPSFNQGEFLPHTLESILSQNYPRLELLVMDAKSTDNSVEVLEKYAAPQLFWVSEVDRGPADAINKGFNIASGDILCWLNSDDTYAVDTLWEVAEEFSRDPELDVVVANALYVNEDHQLHLAHHGTHRTGMYYGRFESHARIPAYWEYVHSVPQPTVFFRRRALEAVGGKLDESLKFIFDFELFFRFAGSAKIKKIERTNAFYRIHSQSKTGGDWSNFLIELYRFSRPHWDPVHTRSFRQTLRSYVKHYMKRSSGYSKRNWRFWLKASVVAAMVTTRIGNPEALGRNRRKQGLSPSSPANLPPKRLPAQFYNRDNTYKLSVQRDNIQFKAFFCSLLIPRYPGHSGGEIRDFHLLHHLLSFSRLSFFSLYEETKDARVEMLRPYLDGYYTAETKDFYSQITGRILHSLIKDRRYHDDANVHGDRAHYLVEKLQRQLGEDKPDFLFVSPQSNPIALMLDKASLNTRLILATYDVEAVRIDRLAAASSGISPEQALRAEEFERDNLAIYDGVIAVSNLDKEIFAAKYSVPPERIQVVENSVDLNYFRFEPRLQNEQKNVMFVGRLSYYPNEEAAFRLIERIMPLVRQKYPDACLWLVGQGASGKLAAVNDNQQVVVTGVVEDVRPYLAYADVTCIPLATGSGTKYKVLEAFSAGVPVVCSPVAAEGLDLTHDTHVLIGETDEEIASGILCILDDPQLGNHLAKAARDLVEVKYSWDANLSKLDSWLEWLKHAPAYGSSQS